jgi:hypothetical protein
LKVFKIKRAGEEKGKYKHSDQPRPLPRAWEVLPNNEPRNFCSRKINTFFF